MNNEIEDLKKEVKKIQENTKKWILLTIALSFIVSSLYTNWSIRITKQMIIDYTTTPEIDNNFSTLNTKTSTAKEK